MDISWQHIKHFLLASVITIIPPLMTFSACLLTVSHNVCNNDAECVTSFWTAALTHPKILAQHPGQKQTKLTYFAGFCRIESTFVQFLSLCMTKPIGLEAFHLLSSQLHFAWRTTDIFTFTRPSAYYVTSSMTVLKTRL